MRNASTAIVALWLMLALPISSSAQSAQSEAARKYDEFSGIQCDDMMAHLDNYAIALQRGPNLQAYIVSYGESHGQLEALMWAVAAKKYLVSNRGIEAKRIMMLYGGDRKLRAMELWLLLDGYRSSVTDAVQPKGVRFKKSRIKYRPCTFFYNH